MIDRIDVLRKLLPEKCAALVTSDINRFYLTSFKSSAGVVVITKKSAYLLVDFRYFEAAKKLESDILSVVCYKKQIDAINEIIKEEEVNSLVVEKSSVTLAEFEFYKDNLNVQINNIEFSLSDALLKMRCVKSDEEIINITNAQKIAEKSYTELLNYIKVGVSEYDIAVELEYLMRKYGAERPAFDTIAVSGKNSSLPHGVPSDKLLQEGDFLTLDFGAVYNGYHSDMTRTVAIKYATDEMKKVYDVVFEAHKCAAQVINSGLSCADVDLAARKYIVDCGYGDYFGHSTGHGVGLEIHEKPTVYKTNENVLESGMIITVEPGIYIPDKFGIRIEDMYLVTDDGAVDLAVIDKELIIL